MNVMETVKCAVDGCPARVVAGAGKFCTKCHEEYEALCVDLEKKHMLAHRRHESGHLGATEREVATVEEPGRGLFKFLGWKEPAASALRRSQLMAELPRVQCGVRQMCALPRYELLSSNVSLPVVLAVLIWETLRWAAAVAFGAALAALGCLVFLRGRG